MAFAFLRAPPPFEPSSMIYLLLRCPIRLFLYKLYHLLNALRPSPLTSTHPIRLVCISDTHDLTQESLPPGDILVHAGDMTNDGSVPSIQSQIDWMASLPYAHKICIAGNHDTYLDPRTRPSLSPEQRRGSLDWKGIRYLQHNSANITLKLKDGYSRTIQIYGAPQIPACGPVETFAFQYKPGLDAWTDKIPPDTTVLVTHTPPKHHLDISLPSGLGCEYLLKEVGRVKPRLHVFGHVHCGAGTDVCHWDEMQKAYESTMGRPTGWTAGILDVYLWVQGLKIFVHGGLAILWERVWGGSSGQQTTRIVNAAQMHGNTGKLGSRVQVVEI